MGWASRGADRTRSRTGSGSAYSAASRSFSVASSDAVGSSPVHRRWQTSSKLTFSASSSMEYPP